MRVAVPPNRGNLALIGVVLSAGVLLWFWLGFFAARVGGFTAWVILPISLVGATLFGIGAFWGFRRRAVGEPALIVDEAGIFDNVSLGHVGRIRWQDLNRVWLVGPTWMRLLCVRPENVVPYIEEQDETRKLIMRVNRALFDSPIIVPLAAVDMPSEQIWESLSEFAGEKPHEVNSHFATR